MTFIKRGLCLILITAVVLTSAFVINTAYAKKATLKTKKLTLYEGKKATIVIKNSVKDNTYSFKTDDNTIAKVTKAGKVTAVSVGSAKITVTEKSKVGNVVKTRKIGICKVAVLNKEPTAAPTATMMPVNE